MDKPLTELSVQALLGFDQKRFLQNVQFSKSNEENLDILLKTITYFRIKVISLFLDFAQKLRVKSKLLEEKYKYLLEDMVKLKDETENMVKNMQSLSEKFEAVKNKQFNLLGRAEIIIFEAKNHNNTLSDAEGQFSSDLGQVKSRIKVYQKDIKGIQEKKQLLEVQEDSWDTKSDKFFLNDWQIKIIRDNLFVMGLEIKSALDKLLSLGET